MNLKLHRGISFGKIRGGSFRQGARKSFLLTEKTCLRSRPPMACHKCVLFDCFFERKGGKKKKKTQNRSISPSRAPPNLPQPPKQPWGKSTRNKDPNHHSNSPSRSNPLSLCHTNKSGTGVMPLKIFSSSTSYYSISFRSPKLSHALVHIPFPPTPSPQISTFSISSPFLSALCRTLLSL